MYLCSSTNSFTMKRIAFFSLITLFTRVSCVIITTDQFGEDDIVTRYFNATTFAKEANMCLSEYKCNNCTAYELTKQCLANLLVNDKITSTFGLPNLSKKLATRLLWVKFDIKVDPCQSLQDLQKLEKQFYQQVRRHREIVINQETERSAFNIMVLIICIMNILVLAKFSNSFQNEGIFTHRIEDNRNGKSQPKGPFHQDLNFKKKGDFQVQTALGKSFVLILLQLISLLK